MRPDPPKCYSVSRDGNVIGDYSTQQLAHALDHQFLFRTDLYWFEGMNNWRPLADLFPEKTNSKLAHTPSQSPPQPPRTSGAPNFPSDVISPHFAPSEVSATRKFFLAAHPQAWRRFWARMIDVGFARIFLEVCALIVFVSTGLEPPYEAQPILAYVGTFIIWVAFLILYEGLLLSWTGTTVGKWLFRIRVAKDDGMRLSFREALGRANGAVGSGLFYLLLYPGLTAIAIYTAYGKLVATNCTKWDSDTCSVVTCRRVFFLRYGIGVILAIGTLVGYILVREFAKQGFRADFVRQFIKLGNATNSVGSERTSAPDGFIAPKSDWVPLEANSSPDLISRREWQTQQGYTFTGKMVRLRKRDDGYFEGLFVEDSGREAWIQIGTLRSDGIELVRAVVSQRGL